jgi:hypothetical protein
MTVQAEGPEGEPMSRTPPGIALMVVSCLALSTAATQAEGTDGFQVTLGGSELDRGVFVSPTSDGGYVVVGVTASEGAGGEDVYLVKTDHEGKTRWTRTFGGANQDNGWVVRETGHGYVVGGYTKSFGAGGFDAYLLAVDFDGELQWSRTYGGTTDDRCWGLLQTADEGYVLVGETVDAESEAEDGLLIKTDAAGKEVWSRTYGGDAGDRLFGIAGADDGGFLLVGQTYSEGAGERDAYVIKTNARGEAGWSRTFGGANRDVGHGVDRTADGNFLITGYTRSFGAGMEDPYLIKINAEGDTLWTRVLAMDGITRAITGEQAADGGFYLVGFKHRPADGSGAALLVHTDQDGRLEWTREFLPTDRSGQSFGYTVRATPDSGCVFTGHTTVGTAGDLDLFLIKVPGPGGSVPR